MECSEEKVLSFFYKSSLCLSYGRIIFEKCLAKIGNIFFEEIDYRHITLTIPELLRIYFYRESEKLSDLMKCGIEKLKELFNENACRY